MRRRTDRGNCVSSRSRSRTWSAPVLNGPRSSRSSPTSPSARSSARGTPLPALRSVRRRPTDEASRRRIANARTPAEERSIHWTSSIAKSTGELRARARRTSSTPTPIKARSGGDWRGSSCSIATASARRCTSGSSSATSPKESPIRSMSAANPSFVSASAGRHERMRCPAPSAMSSAARSKLVLPMPASPSTSRAPGSSSTAPMNRASVAASCSRPMSVAFIPAPPCSAGG